MKHKLIKLISVILIAAMAGQVAAWERCPTPDSLRVMAAAQRGRTNRLKPPSEHRIPTRRRFLQAVIAAGVGLAMTSCMRHRVVSVPAQPALIEDRSIYIPQDFRGWMRIFDEWENRPNKREFSYTREPTRPLNLQEDKLIRAYMTDFFRELTPSLTTEELEKIVDRNMKYMVVISYPDEKVQPVVGIYPVFRGGPNEGYVLIGGAEFAPAHRAFISDHRQRDDFKASMFHEWMHQLDGIILAKTEMDDDAQGVGDMAKALVEAGVIANIVRLKKEVFDKFKDIENGKDRVRECRRYAIETHNKIVPDGKIEITDISSATDSALIYLGVLRERAKKLGLNPDLYLRQVARFVIRYNIPPSAAEVFAQASIEMIKSEPQERISILSNIYVRCLSEEYYRTVSKCRDLEEKLNQLTNSDPLEKTFAAHRLLRSSIWDLLTPAEQKAILINGLAKAKVASGVVAMAVKGVKSTQQAMEQEI